MQIENTEQRWGAVQQIIHWVVVLAVVVQLIVGVRLADLPENDPQRAALLPLHATTGLSILALMLFRLYWRRSHPVPTLPDTLTPNQKKLAHATHYSLYALLISMPIVGYLLVSAYGAPIPFFRAELPPAIGESEVRQYGLASLHAFGAFLLLLVLALHISAALRHAWSLRDGVMERMAPFLNWGRSGEVDQTPGLQETAGADRSELGEVEGAGQGQPSSEMQRREEAGNGGQPEDQVADPGQPQTAVARDHAPGQVPEAARRGESRPPPDWPAGSRRPGSRDSA